MKKVKIGNQYNQVPHLTWDTIWESDKNAKDQKKLKNTNNKKDPQKNHRLGMVIKIITWGLKHV